LFSLRGYIIFVIFLLKIGLRAFFPIKIHTAFYFTTKKQKREADKAIAIQGPLLEFRFTSIKIAGTFVPAT